jgi:acyl carrier protein
MQPDTTKIWTRSEIGASVGKIVVESLGVDEGMIDDQASLVRDLGAESIDFLDISFKCQQSFGIDLPARLIQDRVVQWRDLSVLSALLAERHGLAVSAEELQTVAPATTGAMLAHLAAKHGLARTPGDEPALALALAEKLLTSLAGLGIDLSDLGADRLAAHLGENLHSPAAMAEIMNRFTVGGLIDYIARRLREAGRLAAGA